MAQKASLAAVEMDSAEKIIATYHLLESWSSWEMKTNLRQISLLANVKVTVIMTVTVR